jgi:NADH:ubiquinone reductase (H+-translocating)
VAAADPSPSGVDEAPLVVLGAGYAGLTLAADVDRRARGKIPVVLVDRSPVHELRTELYEIGKLVAAGADTEPWTVPLAKVLDRTSVKVQPGTVQSIDLGDRTVSLDTGVVHYRSLAICLGNVAAYYGVPGAAENTHQVYRLAGAEKLASALRQVELASPKLPGERRPRVIVVGGGSTGTELAAEIATTDWPSVSVPGARRPDVFLLTGSLPFLAGFSSTIVERARTTLARVGVTLVHGFNVTRVDPARLTLEDGSVLAFDVAVWCAGLEAPPVIRELPVPHGRAGRVVVEPTLELPERPGVFAVGDVAELRDPRTAEPVPATAQAALAGARVAAANVVARWNGTRLRPFEYRERGVVVALGIGRAAGAVRRVPVWGSPAAVLKRVVQRDYAAALERGGAPTLL